MLKAGYNVAVTSWENDSDYHNTKVIHVKTIDDCRFLKEFAMLFRSQYTGAGEFFGNGCLNERQESRLNERVKELAAKYYHRSEYAADLYEEGELLTDYYTDLACDMLGYSEYYHFRVCESVDVYYLENDPQVIDLGE